MPKKKTYTWSEQAVYYGKRFLKTFVPALLVILPVMGTNPEGFVAAVLIPALATLDKYLRNKGWYKF